MKNKCIYDRLLSRARRPARLIARTALYGVLTFGGAALTARAQQPSYPITLLTDPSSTRAISYNALTRMRDPFTATTPSQLTNDTQTRFTLFALNFDLVTGDALASLKVEGEDAANKRYVFPVERIDRVPTHKWLSEITVKVPAGVGNTGDLMVRLSYNGTSSNRVRVGFGSVGGGLPDDQVGAVPAAAPSTEPAVAPPPTPVDYTKPAAAAGADAIRFLEQTTFGPTKAEVDKVRAVGYKAWLDEQFALPLPTWPNELTELVPSDSNAEGGCPGGTQPCINEKYSMQPMQRRFFVNALYGQDQLRQRVVFALNQIFVVSGADAPLSWPSYIAPYFQVLERNAFGNYRDLLRDITLNPAMGRYLDMAGNTKTKPNENYAREILQLFSIGLYQMNPDGTFVLDAQGNRIPTYDQATINQFARVFTGWYIPGVTGQAGVSNYISPMAVLEQNHDKSAKFLLNNAPLPANQTTGQDLNGALDNVFFHPNVGPFIGKALIQKLVTSNPSPAYVGRVTAVFNNNGAGVRGDMRAVVTAILLDPEARGDLKNDSDYGHLREPALYIANIMRAFNAKSLDKTKGSDGLMYDKSAALDQDVLKSPTVFNFFSPEYNVPGTELVGPEFGILSTNTVLRRANFVNSLLFGFAGNMPLGGIPRSTNASVVGPDGTVLDLSDPASINWTALAADPRDPAPLLNALDNLLLHGTMTKTMRDSIGTAYKAITATDAAGALKRTQTAIYLVTTSAQFQMEK